MATPSLRTKILVARGTYSNLNASVSDLGEGEICYATDQDKLYVKEGGVLTGISGDVVSVNGQTGTVSLNIDNLTDVDTTTVAPTSGQLLSYDGAQWTPTDAPVPVAGSDTQVQFNDAGVLSGDTGLTFDATTNELTVGVSNADPGTATVKGDLNLDSGGSFSTTIQSVTPTANRTISFPDQTGTVGLVSGATGNIQYNNAGQLAATGDFNVDLNWTDAGVTYTGLKVNVTDTASAAGSNLLDLQVNGSSRFDVNNAGTVKISVPAINTPALQLTSGGGGSVFTVDSAFALRRTGSDYSLLVTNYPNFVIGGAGTGLVTIQGTTDNPLVLAPLFNQVEQRNGTNAQAYRLYNTYTDASNYERLSFNWDTNVFKIKSEAAGTGTVRGIQLGSTSSEPVALFGATPVAQPTTAVGSATVAGGGGTAVDDATTFGGYTLAQVVQALQNLGILA